MIASGRDKIETPEQVMRTSKILRNRTYSSLHLDFVMYVIFKA